MDRIPIELVNLMREYIETYEQLEVLVFLGRHHDREWDATTVEAALRLPPGVGSVVLDDLTAKGLLVRIVDKASDRFRCHPDSARTLSSLTGAYRDDESTIEEGDSFTRSR